MKKRKYCYKSLWLQGMSRLWSIIHETRAYQDSDQSFARLGHIKIPINHLQDIGMSVLRLIIRKIGHIKTRSIICKTLGISRLTNPSFVRLGHIKTPINHRKSLAYPYSNYHSQDLGMSIKTRSIVHKTWVCHRVLVRYIIHMYCLAVQAGFYSDVVECSTLDGRVPGSILTRGMEIF